MAISSRRCGHPRGRVSNNLPFHTGVFSRGVRKTYSNSFAFFFFPPRVLNVLLPPGCWMIRERVLGSLLGQLWSAASSDSPRGHNPPDGGGRQQKGHFLMQMGHRTPDSQAEGSTGTDGREGGGRKRPSSKFSAHHQCWSEEKSVLGTCQPAEAPLKSR